MKQRQVEGIEVALDNGVKFGRPKQGLTDAFQTVYAEWKSGKLTAVAAMDRLGIKRNTFYRRVNTAKFFSLL